MYREKIVDIVSGEITFRDYSPAEIAEVEAAQAEAAIVAAKAAELAAAKTALLKRLGITEEEAKLLLS